MGEKGGKSTKKEVKGTMIMERLKRKGGIGVERREKEERGKRHEGI